MATVALVRTPLSVICAREAMQRFDWDLSDTVLGVFDHPRPAARRQLWSSLEDTGMLDEVGVVTLFPSIGLSTMYEVRQMARGFDASVDELIIGSYTLGPFRQFMDLVEPARVILVDDGAATGFIASRRAAWIRAGRIDEHPRWNDDIALDTTLARGRAGVGRGLARLGLHPHQYADIADEPDELTIFTYLELPADLPDPVVRHSFPRLHERIASAPRSDDVLFLGSPLVRTGKIDRPDYLAYLRRARVTVGDFSYIAHRQERPEDIRAIESEVGVVVDQPSRCIELAIGRELPVPAQVVAPWSSALETLAILLEGITAVGHLPIPLESFRGPARSLAGRRYEQLDALEQTTVEHLDLR